MDFSVNLEISFQQKFQLILMEIAISMVMFSLKKDRMLKHVYNNKLIISKDKKFRLLSLFLEIKGN